MQVSSQTLIESLVFGLNSTGVLYLVTRQLGDKVFEGKCWKELSIETQEQVKELIGKFIDLNIK